MLFSATLALLSLAPAALKAQNITSGTNSTSNGTTSGTNGTYVMPTLPGGGANVAPTDRTTTLPTVPGTTTAGTTVVNGQTVVTVNGQILVGPNGQPIVVGSAPGAAAVAPASGAAAAAALASICPNIASSVSYVAFTQVATAAGQTISYNAPVTQYYVPSTAVAVVAGQNTGTPGTPATTIATINGQSVVYTNGVITSVNGQAVNPNGATVVGGITIIIYNNIIVSINGQAPVVSYTTVVNGGGAGVAPVATATTTVPTFSNATTTTSTTATQTGAFKVSAIPAQTILPCSYYQYTIPDSVLASDAELLAVTFNQLAAPWLNYNLGNHTLYGQVPCPASSTSSRPAATTTPGAVTKRQSDGFSLMITLTARVNGIISSITFTLYIPGLPAYGSASPSGGAGAGAGASAAPTAPASVTGSGPSSFITSVSAPFTNSTTTA